MTLQQLQNSAAERFEKEFVPSSLKWKDVKHCTCCSTEEEYNRIKSFLLSSIAEAVKATDEKWQEVIRKNCDPTMINWLLEAVEKLEK